MLSLKLWNVRYVRLLYLCFSRLGLWNLNVNLLCFSRHQNCGTYEMCLLDCCVFQGYLQNWFFINFRENFIIAIHWKILKIQILHFKLKSIISKRRVKLEKKKKRKKPPLAKDHIGYPGNVLKHFFFWINYL